MAVRTAPLISLKFVERFCRLLPPCDSLLSLYDRPLPAQGSRVMKEEGGPGGDGVLSTNQTDALY